MTHFYSSILENTRIEGEIEKWYAGLYAGTRNCKYYRFSNQYQ